MVAQTAPVEQAGKYHSASLGFIRRHRLLRATQALIDLTILFAAFSIAYLLRFDFAMPGGEMQRFLAQAPFVVLLEFAALEISGARSSIWRYVGLSHIGSFLYAAGASTFVLVALRLLLAQNYGLWKVSLSIGVSDVMLAYAGTFGVRVLRRVSYERARKIGGFKNIELGISRETSRKSKVLLIGAGEAGVLAAREINRRGDLELEIQGFVDDDPQKLGRSVLQGYKVLGTTRDLSRLVSELNTDYVVIAIAQASGKALRRIIQRCEDLPVKVRIIPGLYEILDGRVEISHLRKIQIEDLLGREKIELDEEAISCEMTGKTVMVTGAGGSIGAELARQVLRFSPSMLLLVERAEFALFEIDHELKELNRSTSIASLVGDVGDTARMRSILSQYKPQVIIHAAAHKHVPLMECNVTEAVKNNVLATRVLGELAGEAGADVFVLVSTDKAVRPTSVMGATKRFAEFVTQDLNRRFKTRFVAVRFGNVIGSTGSVIPIFLKQIHKGGPVTITDRRMKRYFMTIPEAAQLVLQASAIGRGGEVFILHMGEPLLITDLAETLISLSGFKPYEDIEIIETGLRPGEKLCEELRIEDEDRAATEHPKIFINDLGALDRETLDTALERVVQLVANRDEAGILMFLSELIPESRLNGASKKTIARASGI